MKKRTKQFNTHFNFAILSIVTVGFLLWHTIAIFNLEQDFTNLQSSITIPTTNNTDDTTQQGTDTQNNEDTASQIIYNEDGSIDTSNWQEYCNQEYGFCVKYPEGWEIKEYKSFSIFPALGPIDCEKTPEKCPFKKIQLYKLSKESEQLNKITSLSIVQLPNDYKISYKDNINVQWMDGLITGCSIIYLFNDENGNKFLLHSFQDESERECQKGQYDNIFDKIVAGFKITK